MCTADIEDFLKRSKRPKVQRDTSISGDVGITNTIDRQEIIEDNEEEEKVASTIRLRRSINKALNNLKLDRGITKDAFIEAAWEICEQNPEVMNLIIQQSKAISTQRRNQGILHRAESTIRKIKG